MRRVLSVLLLVGMSRPVGAQLPQVRVSVLEGLGHYREQGPALDFSGSGPGARLDLTWRRWGLVARGVHLSFSPTDPSSGSVGFTATETEVALRYRPLGTIPAAIEGGVIRRTISPTDAAQELRAYRIGVFAHFVIGDGAEVETRGAWLAGAKFSGGGTAGTGLTLGLRAAYRPVARFPWGWLVADYDFERLDRATAVPVPIQGSTVRLGVEGRFTP